MKAPRHQFAPGTLQQMPTRTQRLRVTLGVALWFCAIAIGVVVSIMWRGALLPTSPAPPAALSLT